MHFNHDLIKWCHVHVSPDVFNASCSRSVKDSIILLRSDINDINGVAKGRSGRAQALPNTCCALPSGLQKIEIL